MTLRISDLASTSTASPAETIVLLAVVVTLVVGVLVAVQVRKRRRQARPHDVQATEVAAQFNGANPVTYYPTYTSLSHEQICEIAAQRGYVLLEQKMTYRGNQALVFGRRDLAGQK